MPTASPFPPGRWAARWIWASDATARAAAAEDDADTDGREVVALRTTIDIADPPTQAWARCCAIGRYVLFVNGVEAARGPVRSNPRLLRFDVVDLAPHLRSGRNVIGALSWRYGGPTAWWLPGPAFANDLAAGAFVLEAGVGETMLVSDGGWTGAALPRWTSTRGHGVSGRGREIVDGRDLPAGWDGDVDPGWPTAITRTAFAVGEPGRPEPPSYPGGPVAPRPISWPSTTDIHLALTPDANAARADRIVAGTLVVDFEAPPGQSIVVHGAEYVDSAGGAIVTEHDASVAFVGDGTRRQAETVDVYGLQAATVEIPDGAIVHSIAVRERLHPSGGGSFECSDDLLNTIWQVGRRTVSLCSHDAYIDCPTREQRAWTGDSVVHQMVDLATNTDWTLARWHPALAATPRPDGMLPMAVAGDAEHYDFTIIPDWALHWVHSVHNLYRYIGDADEIARMLPVAEGVLRWFERFVDDHGTPADVVGWVIVDWSSVYTEGVSAALCGLWGRGLIEFAEMADWLGDRGRSGWARATHERLVAGFERLWDPDAERYVDSLVAGERRPMASQHGQAAAIVGGLAPASRHARLIDVITDATHLVHASFSSPDGPASLRWEEPGGLTPGLHLRTGQPAPWWDVDRGVVAAQPFFRYVVHDAIAAAGRPELIVDLCRSWSIALERNSTSWVETWYGGTISHGWSSTPTRDLVVHVLGVTPRAPGFVEARIAPALGDLAWAKADVPTPSGLLHVEATPERVVVDSPIPFEAFGTSYPAGHHTIEMNAARAD